MNLCVTKSSILQTIFFIPVIVKYRYVKNNCNVMKPRLANKFFQSLGPSLCRGSTVVYCTIVLSADFLHVTVKELQTRV